ncbi:MAG: DNA polymerase I [Chloroflexi bacterium]|nr:DNA polymerase I [Chloroflexota bacterium]
MSNEKRPLLILIDGHAVAYRQYFAMKGDRFVTESGEPTNATFGFTRLLLDILDEAPDYFAISFDAGLSGREELFPDYKIQREEMPSDLDLQIKRIMEVIQAFNIPLLMIEGMEADDIIGTIARQAEEQGCEVKIITGDRDILQLITEHTKVLLQRNFKEDKLYGLEEFRADYNGLEPIQLTEIKALTGDGSDNIPGVEKIGQKTAPDLIQQYGSLEGIYENLGDFKGKRLEYLTRDKDQAFLSRELTTIKRDLDINLHLHDCITHDYDPAEVMKIFRELEFRSLSNRLREMHKDDFEEGDVIVLDENAAIEMAVVVIDDKEKLAKLVDVLETADWIAFDVEASGLDKMSINLVGISLAVDGKTGYYIPVGHIPPGVESDGGVLPDGTIVGYQGEARQRSMFDAPPTEDPQSEIQQLPLKTVIEAIKPALTNPDIPKMAHNATFDLVVMRRYGIDVTPIAFDTMIAEWLRRPDSRNLGLKNLVSNRLGKTMQEITELIGTGRKQISFARVPIEQAAPYATADTAMLHRLRPNLDAEFDTDAIRALYRDVEMPLVPIVADIEMCGVLLDVPYLKEISAEMDHRISALEQEIYLDSGYGKFNINSSQQLNEVLFDKLMLPTRGLTKTKSGHYSLTAQVLDEMAQDNPHPILTKILEYRHLTKLKSTYIDALPALVNKYTGRVHTNYNQTGAVTGRFSSSDPNLQNIPIRTEEGRRIRKAFIAKPGSVLLSVDYSQVELRILAHVSGDKALQDAFRQGLDIHTSTAAAVYKVPMDAVSFEQRSFAKSVNFGLMYGMGAFRLARDSGLSRGEAEDFISEYFAQFPGVKRYLDNSIEQAKATGYVETIFGRRRYFPELMSDATDRTSAIRRQAAEREAVNMPIQGTAADLLKIAMINLHRNLLEEGYEACMMLQVHDELVLEVPERELHDVVLLVKETMENAGAFDVPLRADPSVGHNWYEMEDVE